MPELEYEVVWDGSHQGMNADLLGLQELRGEAPRPPSQTVDRERSLLSRSSLIALLESTAPRVYVLREIADAFGFDTRQCWDAVYYAVRTGLIDRVVLTKRIHMRGGSSYYGYRALSARRRD